MVLLRRNRLHLIRFRWQGPVIRATEQYSSFIRREDLVVSVPEKIQSAGVYSVKQNFSNYMHELTDMLSYSSPDFTLSDHKMWSTCHCSSLVQRINRTAMLNVTYWYHYYKQWKCPRCKWGYVHIIYTSSFSVLSTSRLGKWFFFIFQVNQPPIINYIPYFF